jgi:nitrile hydratase
MHGFGAVLVPGSELPYRERWEPRVFALYAITAVDDLAAGSGRKLRETMPPDEYLRASYYERWLWSNERRLIAKGTITEREVDEWVERLGSGESPPLAVVPGQQERVLDAARSESSELGRATEVLFAPGDAVRVRRMHTCGHSRCPRYVRGAEGLVDAVRGTYPLPDDGPRRGEVEPVYSVAFASPAVFGPTDEAAWLLYLDLHESYLEAA